MLDKTGLPEYSYINNLYKIIIKVRVNMIMDEFSARPGMLKQINLSQLRRVIKNRGTVTRAEAACETKISSTTVRSLLTEMQENGELECVGYDESSGGRKAERYRLKKDRCFGAAFCLFENAANYIIVDICGEIVETGRLKALEGDVKRAIVDFLDVLRGKREIKALGFGVSGVVDAGGYTRSCPGEEPHRDELGEFFSQRYGVPVVLENDIYATALGFGLCYQRKYPLERPEDVNMAFIYFAKNCVSAGFIAGGKIIRGWNNYAGELGLIPADGEKTLDELMEEPMDDARYARRVANIICWVSGILNPQYVAVGGTGYREKCHALVGDALYGLLPDKMLPELLFAGDVLHDYYEGMAHLTAARIFDEIQVVKE